MLAGMSARRFDRDIARLAGPAFVTLLAEPVYLLVDTAVVGHLGTPQLGGLAVASSILLTGYSLCIFLAYGTTAAVARLLGAGDRRGAAEQAVQGMWLGLGVGVVLAAGLGLASDPLVRALGASGEVADHALWYLRISLLGLPFLLLVLAGTGYLRGLQDTRTPLVVAVGTALINLVLELVLVVGLGFGLGASALGTVIAQVAGAGVYLWAVGRSARGEHVALRPDLAAQRRLLRVGADLVIRTAALRGSLLALTAVATRIGRDDVAAHQIAFEIWSFLAMGMDALAIAAQALVGRYLGAGDQRSAREVSNRLLRLGLYASGAVAVLVAMSAPVVGRFFTPDGDVVELVGFLLLWVAVLQPLGAVAFVLDGVLIGAGDQRFLAWGMAAAAVALALAVAPVIPLGLGIGWVWASFGLLMVVRAVVLLVRFGGDRWMVVGASR
ncbi:MAG: MATE family efflux transporter [Acidimicrobiales bacterium]|nr:MATE family efflux transporter [Acidimicrobiales bacterium]